MAGGPEKNGVRCTPLPMDSDLYCAFGHSSTYTFPGALRSSLLETPVR